MKFLVKGVTHNSFYDTKFGRSKPVPFDLEVDASSDAEARYLARTLMLNERGQMAAVLDASLIPGSGAGPLMQPWHKAKLVAFDVETTGLSSDDDRIIEIGFSTYDPQSKRFGDAKSFFVNDGVEISESSEKIHGISNEMIADAPTFKELYDSELREILQDDIVLISHNRGFDLGFLFKSLKRAGERAKLSCLCSMELTLKSKGLGNKNNKLGHIAELLGVEGENSHRAGDDAKLCGEVFLALARRDSCFHTMTLGEMLNYFDDIPFDRR